MECLNIQRASEFVAFALENDLQIAINRRTGLQRIRAALATNGDSPRSCFEWPVESYEKMETFLAQNDAQVHYSSTNTVAVYSMVKLLGSLRRALRDMPTGGAGATFQGNVLSSPTRPGTRSAPLRSPTRALTFVPQDEPEQSGQETPVRPISSEGVAGSRPPGPLQSGAQTSDPARYYEKA